MFSIEARTDGFGAQFQTYLMGITILEEAGHQYMHRPIGAMEHNYAGDADFLAQAEACMNLSGRYPEGDTGTPVGIHHIISTFCARIDYYLGTPGFQELKQGFWANKNRVSKLGTQVAVHVRRPNPVDTRLAGADTPDAYYLGVIARIRAEAADAKPLEFHVYSQGKEEDFEVYREQSCELHLNDSPFATFVALAEADILVTAPSSLSYTAAFLSNGSVYYCPFWHPPAGHWTVCAP